MYNRALIIDDDSDLCTLLKAMLDRHIPDVLFVHSIESCRTILKDKAPDVVFLDNNLPDGKGVSFIKELKLLLPGARIIFISAMPGLKNEVHENGADVFVEKPLNEANVQKALNAQELH
jgi:DNA-binding response OmpR family regulator